MSTPFFEDFVHATRHVLAQLVGPESHDLPTQTLELYITPKVVYFARAIGVAMAVAVHLNVDF